MRARKKESLAELLQELTTYLLFQQYALNFLLALGEQLEAFKKTLSDPSDRSYMTVNHEKPDGIDIEGMHEIVRKCVYNSDQIREAFLAEPSEYRRRKFYPHFQRCPACQMVRLYDLIEEYTDNQGISIRKMMTYMNEPMRLIQRRINALTDKIIYLHARD